MDYSSGSGYDQELLEALQPLMEPCDRATYSQRLREAAAKLGKSIRTVRRWLQRWQKEGLDAFLPKGRADKGNFRISPEWQDFILKTYVRGNQGGRRMSVAQVYLQVQLKARQEGRDDMPCRATVYNFLASHIQAQRQQKRSLRSPGWRNAHLVLKTRDGQEITVEYSNQVWQCDHTKLDVLLVDQDGQLLGRPWLTLVVDSYSRCLMGFHLGFDAPSSATVALALRHAILPKSYGPEYGLQREWGTYGVPQYLYTDGGKDFRSQHLAQIGAHLGFVHHLRRKPADGGLVERPFRTLNTQLLSRLPGYTGSNVQERPAQAEKEACLTLLDLERLLVSYIVDVYNQEVDSRLGDQTRFQRWESGLLGVPTLPTERELDLCLMQSTRRRVQRGGYVQFANLLYKGEHLAGYEGTPVVLRYDPADVTTVWLYRWEKGQEVFLTRAHAVGLEQMRVSLYDLKAARQRLQQKQQELTQAALLAELERRQQQVAANRQERRRQQQRTRTPLLPEPVPPTDETVDSDSAPVVVPPVRIWSLDEES